MPHLQNSPKGLTAKLPVNEVKPELPQDGLSYSKERGNERQRARILLCTLTPLGLSEQPFTAPGAKQRSDAGVAQGPESHSFSGKTFKDWEDASLASTCPKSWVDFQKWLIKLSPLWKEKLSQ
ncbi:uncharacterized protein VP01_232g2 [Puccinia sorghi]|uniref:Uncharacterized protein n=1 Tax=Puccinia sorghi TaxID=27349 RepID=A0A0L6V9D6_9BASI|nr:uncharacterized protein VP01_232g2 [Puccinia sorghi]